MTPYNRDFLLTAHSIMLRCLLICSYLNFKYLNLYYILLIDLLIVLHSHNLIFTQKLGIGYSNTGSFMTSSLAGQQMFSADNMICRTGQQKRYYIRCISMTLDPFIEAVTSISILLIDDIGRNSWHYLVLVASQFPYTISYLSSIPLLAFILLHLLERIINKYLPIYW